MCKLSVANIERIFNIEYKITKFLCDLFAGEMRYVYFCRVMEMEDNKKKRNEKLGDYFFNLSNTTAGTTVIGVIATVAMDIKEELAMNIIVLIVFGTIMTFILASIGYKLLKE